MGRGEPLPDRCRRDRGGGVLGQVIRGRLWKPLRLVCCSTMSARRTRSTTSNGCASRSVTRSATTSAFPIPPTSANAMRSATRPTSGRWSSMASSIRPLGIKAVDQQQVEGVRAQDLAAFFSWCSGNRRLRERVSPVGRRRPTRRCSLAWRMARPSRATSAPATPTCRPVDLALAQLGGDRVALHPDELVIPRYGRRRRRCAASASDLSVLAVGYEGIGGPGGA